jgi:hypothetical protein
MTAILLCRVNKSKIIMSNFKIVPLSAEAAANIRTKRVDDFGNTVIETLSTGSGPCRVSLKPFKVGVDSRLLFCHSPFSVANAFNQCGPIFINAEPVEPYTDTGRFPPEIKANKTSFPLSLIGYSSDQQMVYTAMVGDLDVDEMIEEILANNPQISYLHARNSQAQCFICKIERK